MKVKAKINCNINGIFYEVGDEIELADKKMLIKLNEKGFIQPLTPKQIQELGKEQVKKILKKEEE